MNCPKKTWEIREGKQLHDHTTGKGIDYMTACLWGLLAVDRGAEKQRTKESLFNYPTS